MIRGMLRRRVIMGAVKKSGGVALGSLAVGDMLSLNMNGEPQKFVVAHKGAPSFTSSMFAKYSGFDGGVIVMTVGASQFWSGGTPTWDSWDDNVWQEEVVPLFEQSLDQDVLDAIMPVTIPYRASSTLAMSASNQRIWVPSASECGYDTLDGGTFDYFADSTTRAQRLMATWGSRDTYVQHVTRSGYEGSQYYSYYNISTDGKISSSRTSATHCRICMVLPEDFIVQPTNEEA